MIVHLVTEGWLERWAGERLLLHCGHECGETINLGGCLQVREKAVHFRFKACSETGVLVLTDFRDARCPCVAEALRFYRQGKVLPSTFLLRFAVHELESWLMADVENMSTFLRVSQGQFPKTPDEELYPKRFLVSLARHSEKKSIREALVPDARHGGVEGPGYAGAMQEFISLRWNIAAAVTRSPSLRRCVQRLQALGVSQG